MDKENHRDGDATKQPSQRLPLTCLEQVSSDLVLSMAVQEEQASFTMLETIESESEDEEEEDEFESNLDDDAHFEYEIFQRRGFEVPGLIEFIEDEESSSGEEEEEYGDDMEEDMEGWDVDELTYEELIALGDFIGVEKRGLSKNEIDSCLNPFVCKSSSSSSTKGDQNTGGGHNGIDKCVICQVEYEDGEALVALLPCEHPYHSECISKWLQIRKCCPICSTEVNSSPTPNKL